MTFIYQFFQRGGRVLRSVIPAGEREVTHWDLAEGIEQHLALFSLAVALLDKPGYLTLAVVFAGVAIISAWLEERGFDQALQAPCVSFR